MFTLINKLISLYNKIPNKFKLVIAISLIYILIILFFLPRLVINNDQPFQVNSVKFVLLLIGLLLLCLKPIIQFISQHKKKSLAVFVQIIVRVVTKLKQSILFIIDHIKYNFFSVKDKLKKDYTKRKAQKLPWYLVLGTQQSGKKSIIHNTRLNFTNPQHFSDDAVQYIHQVSEMEWSFSNKAVFIAPLNYEPETDKIGWKKLIRVLKRERKNKPINGVIITLAITDLMQYSNKDRQIFVQEISHYIRDLYESFRSVTPVYIIFNKCDLIDGFMEFFNDLSSEEISQIWGITLPTDQCGNSDFVQNYLMSEFEGLLEQLRKRIMWAMANQHDLRGRELINTFPQQIQLFKNPLISFILELFHAIRFPNAMLLRGMYFTSCNQASGDPIDFMMHAMSKKFQFIPPKVNRERRIGECYFVQEIFYRIMEPEASRLGDSEKALRRKNISYNFIMFLMPALVITSIIGMHNGYQTNKQSLTTLSAYINEYELQINNENNNTEALLAFLPALNTLNEGYELYNYNLSWGMHFLFITSIIQHHIDRAMQRSLHSYFLPRIAAQLEKHLGENIADQNVLYAILKGYLAFSSHTKISAEAIKAPMKYLWDKNFTHQPSTINQLNYFLDYALTKPVEKLPLDELLINRVRNTLEEIIPSERAYGLLSLRGSVSGIPNLKLSYAIGDTFDQLFTDSNNKLHINGLYTREGYQDVYLPQYKAIADDVANDNKDIGLATTNHRAQSASEINHIVQDTYEANYLKQWRLALDNIKIKAFTDLPEAINLLELLTSKQSPLPKLLDIVYDNTISINHEDVQVAEKFNQLNNYAHESTGMSWSKTVKLIDQVHDYLLGIQQSANQDQAALNAAKQAMDGKENPIQILSREAMKAPEPIKRWLLAIADNCWDVIVISAHNELNAKWQSDVISKYNATIRGRFPLVKQANSQVAIANFNEFFGPNGILQSYFDHYLSPFVNTNLKQWDTYKVNNHSIHIKQSTIELFQQANAITSDFFPDQSTSAKFSFSIKPLTLTSKASSIQFIIGNQHVVYSHGPQETQKITWPLPFNSEDANVLITDFDGNQYAKTNTGPWSLFEIFQYGEFKRLQNEGSYRYNLNLTNYKAEFLITGTANMRVFELSSIKGFSLPQVLAPNGDNDNG